MWVEVALLIIIIFALWKNLKKPDNYPPGIWGFPIVGYLPFTASDFDGRLSRMRDKYGNIFCWKIGSLILIFLYDFKTIKDAYLTHTYSNRPNVKATLQLIDSEKRLGVIGTNGAHWHNIRRFILRHLRDLGMGKSKLTSAIHYEAMELVKVMKKQAGKAAPIPKALMPAIINILWQMVASQRYELDDEKILNFQKLFRDLQESGGGFAALLEVFPWLQNIVPTFILNKDKARKIFLKLSSNLKERFMEDINEHIETIDENNPRDFIDDYLIEMERQKTDPESTMSHEDLVGCLADLFAAGLETTTNTLAFSIFYLAKFPEIQKKIHQEIDDVLTNEILVTLEDRPKLPYTDAFIHEALRYSSLTAFGVLHSVPEDTVLEGYVIPKNALILSAVADIHFNSKYFESPKEFRPERFLNSEGKLEIPKDGFLPFGIGKRQCIGESLARMELLIFLTTFLQNFSFSAPPNKEIDINPRDLPLFHAPNINQDIMISIRT